MKAKRNSDARPSRPLLTPRQWEIITLLPSGPSNREIADELGITVATVKVHMRSIFRTLGVANRTQLAIVANGLE